MQKRAYITGCLGFIGSYITRLFLSDGWRVYGVDKQTYVSDLSNLKTFSRNPNFTYVKKDIRELEFLYDCDFVINCAAESHVDNSINDSDCFLNSNITGVKNLLELIRRKNNTSRRPTLLHISTDEVYGDVTTGKHKETDILKPSNPYSATKACSDMLILGWSRTYDIPYIIARPTNNYGIGQYPEKLIPLCIRNLNRGKKIRLHNQGVPIRNWLHVHDTARAILLLTKHGKLNEIYNIDGGFEQSNLETVKKILVQYYCNKRLSDVSKSFPNELVKMHVDFSYNRIGQDVRYSLDDSKIRELGWQPEKNFDEELEKIVRYHKHNFRW